ncbi:MAG: hypothetical protein ACM3WU_06775 [Bacillota bacterium]
MATAAPTTRRIMSTLTSGWRFTLPAVFREEKGWEEGTRLLASAVGQVLELRDMPKGESTDRAAKGSATTSGGSAVLAADCYLGAGGKIIVPAALRDTLSWIPGKRLAVVENGDALTVSPCCGLTRCRSCGSTVDVREVLPNVHLCADCWGKYAMGVRQTRRFPAQARSLR